MDVLCVDLSEVRAISLQDIIVSSDVDAELDLEEDDIVILFLISS